MADENETTDTTTEAEVTETTTEDQGEDKQNEEVTDTTTEAEHQGEVAVDKDARAEVLGEGEPKSNPEQRTDNIEAAKQTGLLNHQAEHAHDHEDGRSQPTQVPVRTEDEA